MARIELTGRAVWWASVAVLVAAIALYAVLGLGGQTVAHGTPGAFHVAEMLLPPIRPWGGGAGMAV